VKHLNGKMRINLEEVLNILQVLNLPFKKRSPSIATAGVSPMVNVISPSITCSWINVFVDPGTIRFKVYSLCQDYAYIQG